MLWILSFLSFYHSVIIITLHGDIYLTKTNNIVYGVGHRGCRTAHFMYVRPLSGWLLQNKIKYFIKTHVINIESQYVRFLDLDICQVHGYYYLN